MSLFQDAIATQQGLGFPLPLAEKYRPRKLTDFLGLEKPRKVLSAFALRPMSSAWVFVGSPGTGKTTMGQALCDAVAGEFHHIPSQKCDARSIDEVVRMCWYCPATPGGFHVVVVDEADRMTLRVYTAADATKEFVLPAAHRRLRQKTFETCFHKRSSESPGCAKTAKTQYSKWRIKVIDHQPNPYDPEHQLERRNQTQEGLLERELFGMRAHATALECIGQTVHANILRNIAWEIEQGITWLELMRQESRNREERPQ